MHKRLTRAAGRHNPIGPAGIHASWAEKHQPELLAGDLQLTLTARLAHPAVRWWWGQRLIGNVNGAYCYLCEDHIVTWDRTWPMPEKAGRAILDHRDQVHPPGARKQGSMTPDKPSDAEPSEGSSS